MDTAAPAVSEEQRLFYEREAHFAQLHAGDSDEALLAYVREVAAQLGRTPNKAEVVGFTCIKGRLGPWPRVLEKAGLKEVSTNRKTMRQKRREAKIKRKRLKKAAESEQAPCGYAQGERSSICEG